MTNPDNAGGLLSQHGMARRLELAADRIAERAPEDNARLFRDAAQCIQTLFNVKEALQGELCRAAPAGGGVDAQRRLHADILEWEQRVDAGEISARELWTQVRPSLNTLRRLIRDSAPAGSGEVADDVMKIADFFEGVRVFVTSREKIKHPEGTDLFDWHVKRLRRAAALLRKLQQGAESDEVMNAVRRYGAGFTNDEIRSFLSASQGQEGGHGNR